MNACTSSRGRFRHLLFGLGHLLFGAWATVAFEPCRIEVVESGSGWPVPLVQLRTTHHVTFVTDNAGRVAFDLPELMNQEVFLYVRGHGYEVPADGFGYRGIRLVPVPGATRRIEVQRTIIAKRLGRLTGAGRFAESQQLGLESGAPPESGVVGCDSVQNAVHRGRLFWAWGDTSVAAYPLGVFHMTGATTSERPLSVFEPPIRLQFDYFREPNGRPRPLAHLPGDGPTWLSALASVPDAQGTPHLVASYVKIRPPLEAYEAGLCVWDDAKGSFERTQVLWKKSEGPTPRPPAPDGHAFFAADETGQRWLWFGNPFPTLRCPPTFEAWSDPARWVKVSPTVALTSAKDGRTVKPHSGSMAWNAYRRRWVAVFLETFGQPSAFGEVWYAEAPQPTGPWGRCVKVLTHDNYTFYNPRIHPEFTAADSPVLLFEGTYSEQFADRPPATPRYDYNQVLYRLDLDDPALAAARN